MSSSLLEQGQQRENSPTPDPEQATDQQLFEDILSVTTGLFSGLSERFEAGQEQDGLSEFMPESMVDVLDDERRNITAAKICIGAAVTAIADALEETPQERAQRIAEQKRIADQERSEAQQKISEAQTALAAASNPALAESLGEIAASISAELGDGVRSTYDGLLRNALNRLKEIQAELESAQ